MTGTLLVAGVPGSPYTRKLLAVLRYRGIAYRFVTETRVAQALPQPRVPLLPTVYFPTAPAVPVTDTTPIIRRLESEYAGRAVIPGDPALALLDALMEDYADEWLTKAMFHYRWTAAPDIRKAKTILPNWFEPRLNDTALAAASRAFASKQIGRLGYVGSSPETASIIEQSFARMATIMEHHFKYKSFLLGSRPASGDFGLFGQLSQLALFDPTPMALISRNAPRTLAWTMTVEDLSGLEEGQWDQPDALPNTLRELLVEIGNTYVTVMLANACAIEMNALVVQAELDGQPWRQRPFPYQMKCLAGLRKAYGLLGKDEQRTVAAILEGTGCNDVFKQP